jgi:hypothetical protein
MGSSYTKVEATAADIVVILTALYQRADDIPATPLTRVSFHHAVLQLGTGGFRPGCLEDTLCKQFTISIVRDSDDLTRGRLYHHLGILSRQNVLQQLYYHSKSLCVEMPFLLARKTIMTLFEPLISRADLPPIALNFTKTHGILFSGEQLEELEATMDTFFRLLDDHIGRSARGWLEAG